MLTDLRLGHVPISSISSRIFKKRSLGVSGSFYCLKAVIEWQRVLCTACIQPRPDQFHLAMLPCTLLLLHFMGKEIPWGCNCKIANQFHSWGSSLKFIGVLLVWNWALLLCQPRKFFSDTFSNKKSAWNGLSSQLESCPLILSNQHSINFNPAKSFIIYYVEVLALHSLDVPYKNCGYINCYA